MDYIKADEYYSIVPEWVLDLPVSAQAIRLYAILNRYADKDSGECFPSISTLAKRMHTSASTVKRALVELKTNGCILSEARFDELSGERTSNLYTVLRKSRVIYEHPQTTDDPNPSSPKTHKLKSSNKRTNAKIYIALTQALGREPVTQTERAGWNKCVKELREANATSEDVLLRAEVYRVKWKNMTLTPYALVKHWSFLGQVAEDKPKEHSCKENGHNFVDNGIFGTEESKYGKYKLEICRYCLKEQKIYKDQSS